MNAALLDENGDPIAAVSITSDAIHSVVGIMQPNSLSSLKLYCISRDISVIRVAMQSRIRSTNICTDQMVMFGFRMMWRAAQEWVVTPMVGEMDANLAHDAWQGYRIMGEQSSLHRQKP